jgi:protocatechuate 3,4-dioxygenase beta subunit
MTRVTVVAAAALIAGALAMTQAVAPQVRDIAPPQNQPTERLVPIGTSGITGTVTAADTGRPVRGANVNITAVIGTPPSSGPLAGIPVNLAPGVRGGVSPSVAFVNRQAVTDSSGRFSFERLPGGSYTVNVFRQQFLQTNYGQRKPGGQGAPVVIGEGQSVNITVPLMRGGSITGTVFAEDGAPEPQTQVSAWRITMNNGLRRVQQMQGAQTDDRGQYRIFGLQPGDYFVSAAPFTNDRANLERVQAEADAITRAVASGAVRPPAGPGMPSMAVLPVNTPGQPAVGAFINNQPPGYLPTFSPNVNAPSKATPVHVAGGDEHTNVDVQLSLIESTTIVGTVSPAVEDGVGVQIGLIPVESTFDISSLPSTRSDQEGKFTLRNVAPGKYYVFAQTVVAPNRAALAAVVPGPGRANPQPQQLTDAQHMWARATVDVSGQSSIDVTLALKPGRSISGNVVFDFKTAPVPNPSQRVMNVTLMIAPALQQQQFGPLPSAQVGPDGRFTMNGVIAGQYSLRANFAMMKSSMLNGQDTLDFPFDFTGEADVNGAVITLTDAATQLSGHLTEGIGKPALDYSVVLFTTDERYWTPGSRRVLMARTDNTGAYTFRGVVPGAYMLGAVTDLEQGGQFDPELLKSLRSASKSVTVTENEKVVLDLRVK